MLEDERNNHTYGGLPNKTGHEGTPQWVLQASHYWRLGNMTKEKVL